jgi:hypothetical protein
MVQAECVVLPNRCSLLQQHNNLLKHLSLLYIAHAHVHGLCAWNTMEWYNINNTAQDVACGHEQIRVMSVFSQLYGMDVL